MSMLFRYVNRELLLVLAVVFAILIFLGVGVRLTGYLQDAAGGRFPPEVLWTLIALRLPEFVQIVLPFSLFLAILVTFGRIHADQEYVVLLSGGAGPLNVIRWTFCIVVPCCLVVGFFSLHVTPIARTSFVDLIADQYVSSEIAAIVPGEFRIFSKGNRNLYAKDVDQATRTLSDLFYVETNDNKIVTVNAEHARIRLGSEPGERILELENGRRYEGIPGNKDYRVIAFDELSLRLALDGPLPNELDFESRRTNELDLDQVADAQEFHWRLALPIMTLVGGLFAFGISRTRPRSGRFGQIVPGILVFVLYYVLLVFARQAMTQSHLFSVLGLWPIHGVFLAAALYWVYRQSRPAR